ncbi:replicative DNA helicase [Thalassospira marina]|uniref:Replicative DNA helicase n=1 Tax=Thalassospira marina TaxID=2048283 RepID=A0A2N3KVA5_9PROT|nr:replicative DNA helicase [Thalassospira marina]PKR54416.1 replicative DNA helicase [Thalassospira marina]
MSNLDDIFGTAPVDPHHAEAEAALLASLMFNNDGFDDVSGVLRAEHFYDPSLGRIYEAMGGLIMRGHKANPVTLKRVVPDDMDAVLGVFEDESMFVSAMNNEEYAAIIVNCWLRREYIRIGLELVDNSRHGSVLDDAAVIHQMAEAALFDLATGLQGGGGAAPIHDLMEGNLAMINEGITAQRAGKVTGTPVGITNLDRDLSGFQPGNLIILAGRPSMGKTALALSMALNAAQSDVQPGGVAFFSLEMSEGELVERLLSNAANLDYTAIIKRVLSDGDYHRLCEAGEGLRKGRLYIDDRPSATVARMRTECRKIARRAGGLKLVIVDYLQLMSGAKEKGVSRYEQITEISMHLKRLAKELRVPVIALSQLSRAVEQRDDKRPQLSDLRESGSIEQDADVVMFVYREQYYLERSEPVQKAGESADKFSERYMQWQDRLSACQGTADIIVAKARRGKVGTVRCAFLGHRQRFADLDKAA